MQFCQKVISKNIALWVNYQTSIECQTKVIGVYICIYDLSTCRRHLTLSWLFLICYRRTTEQITVFVLFPGNTKHFVKLTHEALPELPLISTPWGTLVYLPRRITRHLQSHSLFHNRPISNTVQLRWTNVVSFVISLPDTTSGVYHYGNTSLYVVIRPASTPGYRWQH
jgi:hypothetical protein